MGLRPLRGPDDRADPGIAAGLSGLWTHGCPGGESVTQVTDRADRAVALALHHMASRDVLFSSHGHFSRAVITRWLQLPLVEGSRFASSPPRSRSVVLSMGYDSSVRSG